jgi:CAAX protease family protein
VIRLVPTPAQRRLIMLALASGVWLVSFAELARMGTWTTFAVGGAVLALAALVFGAVPAALLRPSAGKVAAGLVAGVLMAVLTHLAYAVVAPLVPEVRAATSRLLGLLNVGGFSPGARALLIVVIATSEEVLFRGALGGNATPRIRGLQRGDLLAVAALAAVYALATVTLGSPLLMACALGCGIAWGVLRVLAGSLVVPIIAHVVWDLGVLVVWPMASSG